MPKVGSRNSCRFLLLHQDEQFIPEPLRGHTQYLLNSEENYAKLYAFLTGQGGVTPGELGSLKTLARNPVEPLGFGAADTLTGRPMTIFHSRPIPRSRVEISNWKSCANNCRSVTKRP